ncbi:MAG: hypothetical protein HOF38_05215 [Elusimicrobiaceae bacterium]|jgi:hypothetical protein|nr:hypothetical protein [Elusimicrobiaceae bacterium]MBT3955535.1 hypothetical protein [Elusimicrobiaceae bacterium]MBT4008162.1 hypothetical protein [Elusimicrobiaceae bacterium]MBT4402538.1 hypothetical protein [Elusimicrobiaceae bacterium]MBT4439665.1 hypothetical protein [Elusimicrobiaceae bacterium]
MEYEIKNKISLNETLGSGAELYEMVHQLLERREKLNSYVEEFNVINNALKQYFKGVPNFSIGNFIVKGNWKEVVNFYVPENIKKRYKKIDKDWDIEIKNINS